MTSPQHRNGALQTVQTLFMLYVLAIGIKFLCWDGPRGSYRYLYIPPDPNEAGLSRWDLALLCLLYCVSLTAMGFFAWLLGLSELAFIVFLASWSGVFLWQHLSRDRSKDSNTAPRIDTLLKRGNRLGPPIRLVITQIYPLAVLLYAITKWLRP